MPITRNTSSNGAPKRSASRLDRMPVMTRTAPRRMAMLTESREAMRTRKSSRKISAPASLSSLQLDAKAVCRRGDNVPEQPGLALTHFVMAGLSRLKDGVASARLCPGIHVFAEFGQESRGWPGRAHGCPARFLLGKVHGIDSNGVQSFATQLDMKRISAVPHMNTVFRDILKLVPWSEFDKLVKNNGSDELTRSFTTKRQFVALLYGQLSGACSLRDIEASMTSHQGRLYHAGGLAPKRSTIADANRGRNPEVFSGLFMHMLAMTTRGLRRKLGDAVRLIDSTGLHLAGVGANWARFSAEVCGAKAHVVYDPDLGCPIYHMITEATVNDITAAKTMPIEAGATYVFDLGYYDYGWWA